MDDLNADEASEFGFGGEDGHSAKATCLAAFFVVKRKTDLPKLEIPPLIILSAYVWHLLLQSSQHTLVDLEELPPRERPLLYTG